MSHPFGQVEHMAWWTLRGEAGDVLALGWEISHLTGMTLHGEPHVTTYPTPDGKGGAGTQVYFPWVESWLIIGTWPELGLVRVAMSTCAVERFAPVSITKFLEGRVGYVESYGWAEW